MHVDSVEGQPRPFLKTTLSDAEGPLRGAQRDYAEVVFLVAGPLGLSGWMFLDAGDAEGPCFALSGDAKNGMTSSSGKRVKTMGNKRKDPERFYSNKFLSHKQERNFVTVQDQRLLMERKVRWIPSLAPQFGEEVERREWEKLAAYPKPTNIAVVKEFYTNARPFGNTHIENYMSYVRGNIIRAVFLYCVLKGMNINIGQVIANEIQTCASSVNNKAPLGHPSLITHLCELDGVPPPHPPRVHRRVPPPAQEPPHDAQPFQMRDMYMSLMESRMQALHRGQAQASGARVAEASTMEDDDEDDDYEDGDEEEAYEDEEEDSE
ncbi:hypothetical protein LR48_Vigan347s003000 [Vigna angularis]|uniref:Putative plant transposon protein domain-containing protein n=1 Tax=Phaseolus angularis TaxID=3914 RepID=A0A0L9T9F3_PHAAN|nr:hypothetical protein LR48_Vigan347s003000 [Vigna angularis]